MIVGILTVALNQGIRLLKGQKFLTRDMGYILHLNSPDMLMVIR